MDDVVLKALAPNMHVGKEAEEEGIVGQCAVDFDLVVCGAGRDGERIVVVGQLQGEHPLLDGNLGKDDPDTAGKVVRGTPGRQVGTVGQLNVSPNVPNIPTRTIVHGRVEEMIDVTGTGKSVIDTPSIRTFSQRYGWMKFTRSFDAPSPKIRFSGATRSVAI